MAEPVDDAFLAAVRGLTSEHGADPAGLDALGGLRPERLWELYDAQAGSRHLDLAAKWLREKERGYYTIGSAGHEGDVAVAAATRPTDPALLHYRSGAFFLERSRQAGVTTALRDVLLGMVAGREDPISGGRHKVWGSEAAAVVPTTSTIASHLPRALGLAVSIGRARRLGVEQGRPADSIVVCSFGDASANHSTALGAINAALNTSFQGLPVPLLLVCEDNGIGISVPTPDGWIRHAYGRRPGLAYLEADASDLPTALEVSARAAEHVRRTRTPAFLHLRTVRLMGHAGADVETSYRSTTQMQAEARRDPLLATARLMITSGLATADEVLARYEAKREEVMGLAEEAAEAPGMTDGAEVAAPLAPADADAVARRAAGRSTAARSPEDGRMLTLAQAINRSLADVLAQHPGSLVFGEDVAAKGGVYGVTRGLMKRFGRGRVFDTLLDEQSILGLGLGAGISGLLPIPEIQYLAYLHNAEDQLRGEAASQRFFSNGAFRNPMVVRVPGYGYQKGFGGHFHNDNAVGVLRDVPGLVIASPSLPDDAAAMLRTCAAAADVDGTVSVFLEPIALYHTRDLHEPGDDGWLRPYAGENRWADAHVPIGVGRTHVAEGSEGEDLTIVTFGNGVRMSLRVAKQLEEQGVGVRVLDLRWLAPLPVEDLLREANATGRVLVVDETRRSGGVSEGVVTALVDEGFTGKLARVASLDSFVPLGDAANLVLVSEDQILAAATALLDR
ncbi:thiamine pyrophosphate-dependent enzyme [Nocardioides sp. CFH 31398]|uniref:thiamine pyrophosphate-dependent enzyme n=1 Tax=Nocardioides sp. CFH 31398 TaxID=2919579 RepID=UPI001F0540A8|nr:thiamine pyrophosphate-dependent enzyme [Nocardioides sp. CFH 31398]MCH1867109.1 thiamine pyrophosphate-dependent enzyme [Nocardioides sp. CFH 31398]